MSTEVQALLVFCEGPHDLAFVRLVLRKIMVFNLKDLKFSDMPSPFHHLFAKAVKTHAASDMSLGMAHRFFLPDTVLIREQKFVFLYSCGGKNQYDKIRTLLSTYIPMFEQAKTFSQGAEKIVESIKYLFLYDADCEGIETIADNLTRNLGQVNGSSFVTDWELSESNYGRISKDKALFIWGGNPNQGTLEDLLLPIFSFPEKNKAVLDKAKTAMKEMFRWETEHQKLTNSVAEKAKYLKAVLTASGQRMKPGYSLNVVLEQSGLVSKEALQSCKVTVEFVQFLEGFWKQ